MKAVILDSYAENPGDLSWEGLSEICNVVEYPCTDDSLIVQRIGDAEIVITNKMPNFFLNQYQISTYIHKQEKVFFDYKNYP